VLTYRSIRAWCKRRLHLARLRRHNKGGEKGETRTKLRSMLVQGSSSCPPIRRVLKVRAGKRQEKYRRVFCVGKHKFNSEDRPQQLALRQGIRERGDQSVTKPARSRMTISCLSLSFSYTIMNGNQSSSGAHATAAQMRNS